MFYIVCGDININMLESSSESKDISNSFTEFNMTNIVKEPTITKTTAALIVYKLTTY